MGVVSLMTPVGARSVAGPGAALTGLDLRRGRHVVTQANLVVNGIPDFVAHPVQPEHLTAVDVIGPGGTRRLVKFAGEAKSEMAAPLRFVFLTSGDSGRRSRRFYQSPVWGKSLP